jgi:teichoic acid transport system permease protein
MTKSDKTDSGFLADVHVYEPHRVGLPPLKPYITELWRRRQFAAELSRTNMRAANTRTFFGQIWLLLNPLLLAGVYYVLTVILSSKDRGPGFLDHLVAGLFAYYLVSGTISAGASSVVGSGALISNMAFPRILMPLAAVRTAVFRFLPTMPVYAIIHLIGGGGWQWQMLLAPLFLGAMIVFATGLAAVFAALQVYFRDTSSFLPYFLRIWLYLSPVLWLADDVPHKFIVITKFNPLFYLIGGWTELLVRGEIPPLNIWIGAGLWSVAVFVVGSLFFISREREFAVRL